MTSDEEGRLWQAEMDASRVRYSDWLRGDPHRRGPVPDSVAVARARILVREARELVAVSRALRSRNR